MTEPTPPAREDSPDAAAEVTAAVEECRRLALELASLFEHLGNGDLDVTAWLDARAKAGLIMKELNRPAKVVSAALGLRSGKDRIRAYLLVHIGEIVTNHELAGVAGTLEWARRVRELSVEEGLEIASEASAGLRPGEYRLDAGEANMVRAARWRTLSQIRRSTGSAAFRCLSLLQELFPEAASKEDLAYVARIQEWPRRMREMEEAGWSVVSSNDDPSIPVGSYRLDSITQGPPRRREAIRRRHTILERDNWTCSSCGSRPSSENDVSLHVHHIRHVSRGGGNEDDNLVTLCAACRVPRR